MRFCELMRSEYCRVSVWATRGEYGGLGAQVCVLFGLDGEKYFGESCDRRDACPVTTLGNICKFRRFFCLSGKFWKLANGIRHAPMYYVRTHYGAAARRPPSQCSILLIPGWFRDGIFRRRQLRNRYLSRSSHLLTHVVLEPKLPQRRLRFFHCLAGYSALGSDLNAYR